jgi:hypothetical protein
MQHKINQKQKKFTFLLFNRLILVHYGLSTHFWAHFITNLYLTPQPPSEHIFIFCVLPFFFQSVKKYPLKWVFYRIQRSVIKQQGNQIQLKYQHRLRNRCLQ